MNELLQTLANFLLACNPCRIVMQWEAANFYICGRYQKTLTPGLHIILPGLMDIRKVSLAAQPHTTPLQTITLKNNQTLTYSASVMVVVRDPEKAYHRLDHFSDSIVELVARVLSEGLAHADPERLDPKFGKRRNLLEEQRELLNEACGEYGLEVTQLGLNNCVIGIRTLRLLMDRSVIGGSHDRTGQTPV